MTAPACPVCAHPVDGRETHCPTCAWLLRGDPVLGRMRPEHLAAFERTLTAAGRRWDLMAAARVVSRGAVCDAPARTRRDLGHLVRGGPPDDEAWSAAVTAAAAHTDAERLGSHGDHEATTSTPDAGIVTDVATDQAMARSLDGIAAGESGLCFVECSPRHLALQHAAVDQAGTPHLSGSMVLQAWSDLAGEISDDPVEASFQLAGGVGGHPVDRQRFDAAVTTHVRRHVARPHTIVVLPRTVGWTLLDRAAAALARVWHTLVLAPTRAAMSGADASSCVTGIANTVLRRMPLAYDHVLLLHRLRDGGAIEVVPRTLFPAGTRVSADTPLRTTETVYGGPVANAAAALPVLARRGVDTDPATWPVLRVGLLAVQPAACTRLAFVLERPGHVRIEADDGTEVTDTRAALPDLLAGVPERLPSAPALDLVCAIELCGRTTDIVTTRLAFAHDLAELARHRFALGGALRVGAIGYIDHEDRRAARRPPPAPVLPVVPLGPPERLANALRGWTPRPERLDAATSVEDALVAARRMSWLPLTVPEERGRRVLVLIGRRPPSLPFDEHPIPACAAGIDWRKETRRLHDAGVRVVGVVEPPSQRAASTAAKRISEYAALVWRELTAPEEPFDPAGARPQHVLDLVAPDTSISATQVPFTLVAPPGRE